MKANILAASTAFFISGLSAYGQAGQSTQPSMAAGQVLIANSIGRRVLFGLLCEGEGNDWSNFELNDESTGRYSCPNNEALHIRIVTNSKGAIDYLLPYGKRYKFFWNANNALDVAQM